MAAQRRRRPPASATVFAPAVGVVAGTGLAVVVFLGMRDAALSDGDAGQAARRGLPAQVSVSLRSVEPNAAAATGAQLFDPVQQEPAAQAGAALPMRSLFVASWALDGVAAQASPASPAVVPVPVAVPPATGGGVAVQPGGGPPPPPIRPTDPPTEPGPEPPTDPPTDPGLPDPGSGGDPSGGDPGPVDPGTVDPDPVDPGTVDPGTTDPGTTDPGTTDPGTTDPGTTDPGSGDPGTTEAGTTDPLTDPAAATGEAGTDPTQWDVPAA